MLSFIYRLLDDFEQEHGYRPNVLYLSPEHCAHLREAFSPGLDMADIRRHLGLEIVLDASLAHPRVAWLNLPGSGWQRQAAG